MNTKGLEKSPFHSMFWLFMYGCLRSRPRMRDGRGLARNGFEKSPLALSDKGCAMCAWFECSDAFSWRVLVWDEPYEWLIVRA